MTRVVLIMSLPRLISYESTHKIALYQVLNRSGIFRAQFLAGGGIGGLTSPPNNVSLYDVKMS